ncbi:MAG: hypothetical protein LC746_04375 [Acidobacteria bacterium]|nr:hypothetical protein [Acidobacteriota bacterium]
MRSPPTLLALLVCACVCAAQDAPPRQDVPPGLVVLRVKWERQLDAARDAGRSPYDASRDASDPDALNNPGGLRTASTNPFPPYVYQYSVEVRNDGAKKIRWLSWEYVLSDPAGKKELGRHEFVSPEKIEPAKKKTLRGRTRSTPARLVTAAGLAKGKRQTYDERVEFRCVAYDDGTWWHRASLTESDCVAAEKRGK